MQNKKRNISIQRFIIYIFIISLVISVTASGALIFTNWLSSAKKTTERISVNLNEKIYDQVNSFMLVPYHINEINHKFIETGMLDLSDEKQRDRFFVGVLRSYSDEIYSFSYGTVNGEYYGARRNELGIMEIMKNNASTGGNSFYYSVNEDKTAGALVVQAGQFDPRTRAWYKAAVEAGEFTFSPIYKHFVMDDLTVSAAWPIYNEPGDLQGVLGTHILLTGIGSYLKDAVEEYDGVAIILEKNSNALIANSMDIENFTILQDGTLARNNINDIQNPDIQNAYEQFTIENIAQFVFKGKNDTYFINTREIHMNGIDWVVISAIPESFFMADVVYSARWAAFIATLSLLLSVLVYYLVTGKLLKPLNSLLQVSTLFSTGDLSKRVEVVRNDEVGLISGSFNNVADKMQLFIQNLESKVKERTEELHKANLALEEKRGELRLILDSAAEAIFGIDINGNCIFCNASCIKMLGYNNQDELLGKNMHWQVHHTRRDGSPFPIDECKILRSYKQGKGFGADDEVFWKADGTSFDVEYQSYPQIKNGEVIGAVITFMDITDRKLKEAEIQYLSCHDPLTSLHNRRCFEDNQAKIDIPENLPLSVIFADVNGLKMTNDIFGHIAGDALLQKSAEILVKSCRDKDVVARVGGDEFMVLLPRTNAENALKILTRIRSEFRNVRVAAIKCSISLGSDTKTNADQSLEEIMSNAENEMYRDKTMNQNAINKDIIDTIIETLHSRNPKEKQNSILVDELCGKISTALHLKESEIAKSKRAGFLHDIGKITLDESILIKETLTEEEQEKIKQHTVVGYRILNLFDETLDLAEYVYGHHERWDGLGYPRGLKQEQIPLISRIITIAEAYEHILRRNDLSVTDNKKKALEEIEKGSGTQFDPHIVQEFVKMMSTSQE